MLKDDFKNSKDNLMGKSKEAAGRYIDNDRLELKGKDKENEN